MVRLQNNDTMRWSSSATIVSRFTVPYLCSIPEAVIVPYMVLVCLRISLCGKYDIVPYVIHGNLKDEFSNTDVPSGDDLRQTNEDEMELAVSTYDEDAKTCDRPKTFKLLFCQNVSI